LTDIPLQVYQNIWVKRMPEYCPECGSELKSTTKFCGNCGLKIKEKSKTTKSKTVKNSTKVQTQKELYTPSRSTNFKKKYIVIALIILGVVIIFAAILLPFTTEGYAYYNYRVGDGTEIFNSATSDMMTVVTARINVKNIDLRAGVDSDCIRWRLHLQNGRTYCGEDGHGTCFDGKTIYPKEEYNFSVSFYIFDTEIDTTDAEIEYLGSRQSISWFYNDFLASHVVYDPLLEI
jgi:outer membrane protein assembly factor BamB